MLEDDERSRFERLHVQAGQHLGTGELERAHEREPVTAPLERRGGGLGREHLPGIVRRSSVEAVLDVSDATRRTCVRRRELPASAVGGGPRFLGQIPGDRRLGRERRAAEQPPSGRQVHELEDLGPVGRIDEREQLLRAQDDHGVGRLGAASRSRRV